MMIPMIPLIPIPLSHGWLLSTSGITSTARYGRPYRKINPCRSLSSGTIPLRYDAHTGTRLLYNVDASASAESVDDGDGNGDGNGNGSSKNGNDRNDGEILPVVIDGAVGLNELHTLLRDAVAQEDYGTAGVVSNELANRIFVDYPSLTSSEQRARRREMSWSGLGAAPWLTDRLESLNYTFPTTIQINSFLAVNAILSEHAEGTNPADVSSPAASLEERVSRTEAMDMGIVVSGTTGSGKTLSYGVPLLSTLSDSLFLRQRLRISDEEAVGDTMGDLVDRISVVTSPRLTTSSRKPVNKGPIATGASIATLGRSGTDITSPLALVVLPTRELGVQTAMLLYRLVGGNIKEDAFALSGKANMFKYKGPKGIRIGCVLDDEEATFGLKLQTDIVITTPQYLSKLLDDGDVNPSKLRVIVYDEADLALEQTKSHDLERLFADDSAPDREFTRLTLLVGASVTEALGNLAVSSRILPAGKSYIATATSFAPLRTSLAPSITEEAAGLDQGKGMTMKIVGAPPKSASLQDLNVCLYPGLTHERVIVTGNSGLLVLTRLLRTELQDYERAVVNDPTSEKAVQRPRVVVFFPDEAQAKAAIAPLRDALWGEHRLCVLLPKTGFNPMTMMEQFKQNETTVMLATPNSVRGLDFPSLSHVYTLYLPMDDPREYLHLAGRVGRVGHRAKGHVVSVLQKEDAGKMDDLAKLLGFDIVDLPAPTAESLLTRNADGEIDDDSIDYEKLRRAFEDTISFVDMAEDPVIRDPGTIEARAVSSFGNDDDDDDDDAEDDDNTEASFQ